MGTNLAPVLSPVEINLENLSGKKLVIDSYNTLYQYLASIRQQDGTPLMDSKGNVTSHLSGLFFRTINMMEKGMKPAFCFDGKAPELKKKEQERRRNLKEEAIANYEVAKEAQDIESMQKFAKRTGKLTTEMIAESKELILAMGLPVIQAPSEAEAQCSYMAKKGDFYAVVSQDTDSLVFGASRIIKNLTLSERKKIKGTFGYEKILPEEIILADVLNRLSIDQDQLIALSMLVGTDFNIGGIKGIGAKKGLILLKKYSKDFDSLFSEAKWSEHFDYPWKEVFDLIKNMPVTDDYNLNWKSIDKEKIIDILVTRHGFSIERIEAALEKQVKKQAQKGLGEWF
ncbi:MAG: flap endonuclease-1 [archaeon]